MSILDWFKSEPTQLKLRDDSASFGSSKVGMPKAPPLDVALESLLKYSRKSELVYACIEKKAQSACDAVLVVEKRTRDGDWETQPSHPLINLMNRPNQYDTGESFLKSWIASENFCGNFYCEIVRSGAGVPVGLYPLNPVYLVPQYVMDSHSWRIDFYYYFQSGYPVRLEVADVMIRRRHSLGSIYSDVSAIAIALGSIDADSAMTDYVRAFFNNGGAPSGILNIKDKRLSDDEAAALQMKWTNRYARGGVNRGGVAILDSVTAEWQSVGSNLGELNSEPLDEKAETRICMAFGVPPILIGAKVGLKHVTQNATAKAALSDFWVNTMSPELKSIRTFMTWFVLPMFENAEAIKRGDIRVNWDMSQVAALQEDLDDIHARTRENWTAGLVRLNEARSAIKLDPVEGEEGEAFYKAPAPAVNIGSGDPPPEKPKQLSPVAETKDEDALDAEIIEPLEKKTFNYNGMTLRREPSAIEQIIDLKSMQIDYDDGKAKIAVILLALRDELIKQSVVEMRKLDGSAIHELALTPPDKAYAKVSKAIDALFAIGRDQVESDLALQKVGSKNIGDNIELKKLLDDWKRFLDRISDLVISRLISEISTRAINFFVARGLLDRDDTEIIAELREALTDQSDKMFEDIASQASNAAIGAGRSAELEERADDIEIYEYSALLDSGTCEICDEADGKQSKDPADLPDAPNSDCLGNSRCRCFIVGIGKEENA